MWFSRTAKSKGRCWWVKASACLSVTREGTSAFRWVRTAVPLQGAVFTEFPHGFCKNDLFPLCLAERQVGKRIRGQIWRLSGSQWHLLYKCRSFRARRRGCVAGGAASSAAAALETVLFSASLCSAVLSWVVRLAFYNRDNVEWSEEQEASARSKVQENSSQLLPPDKQGTFGYCCNVGS